MNIDKLHWTDEALLLGYTPQLIAEIVDFIDSGWISGKVAKDVLSLLAEDEDWEWRFMPLGYIIEEKGWWLNNDSVSGVIDKVFADNPDQVEKAKINPKLAGWLVGQVLKIEKTADPKLVKKLIDEKISA